MKTGIYIFSFTLFILISCNSPKPETENAVATSADNTPLELDPLPSWNEGKLKTAILRFVTEATTESSTGFIPIEDRIATFDNDGTLWAEKPYVQVLFAMERIKKMVEKNPELRKKQPFKAVVDNDRNYFAKAGDKALLDMLVISHTGMTEAEFDSSAAAFFSSARYPGRNVPISEIVYKPQLELLHYLRANGFRTFICTGGTVEFVRAVSWTYYGIPEDQVIGTSFQYEFIDSSRTIYRKPALASFNDKSNKPVNIQLHIGKHPVFACGNEGGAGDIAMLKFSQSSIYPSFQLLVNHNDSLREYFYTEKDSASLKAAHENNWHVVSMKDDWKQIFDTK